MLIQWCNSYSQSQTGIGRKLLNNPIENNISVKDIDGNSYPTVVIGKLTWMNENLKTSKLNDGTSIPIVSEKDKFLSLYKPVFSWFNNDKEKYFNSGKGALYNYYTVETKKLCPLGWRIANENDFKELYDLLRKECIDSTCECKKERYEKNHYVDWLFYHGVGINSKKFNLNIADGGITNISCTGPNFWITDSKIKSTSPIDFNGEVLWNPECGVSGSWLSQPIYGYSVRCVKD